MNTNTPQSRVFAVFITYNFYYTFLLTRMYLFLILGSTICCVVVSSVYLHCLTITSFPHLLCLLFIIFVP